MRRRVCAGPRLTERAGHLWFRTMTLWPIRLFREARRPPSPPFFSQDWFTYSIPQWEAVLAGAKGRPNFHAIEVGSYEGRSARWLLENVLTGEGATLDCIDPFLGTVTPMPGAPDDMLERFLANIAPWRERVTVHRGESWKMLRGLEGPYHFAYIDGSHWAADALSDAVLIWPLLAEGAILIFDDYTWDARPLPHERPRLGIDSFLACHEGRIELLQKSHLVAIRKTKR